jgi:hypothetical protein
VPRPVDPQRSSDLTEGQGPPLGNRRHRMLRWTCALITAAVLSGFAFLLLTGDYINEGPVLATVSKDHGIHSGDLWILAGWAVAMVSLIAVTAMPEPG